MQTKQGSCSVGGLAPATYDKRQGAHKRSIRGSFLQVALADRHSSVSHSHSMSAKREAEDGLAVFLRGSGCQPDRFCPSGQAGSPTHARILFWSIVVAQIALTAY